MRTFNPQRLVQARQAVQLNQAQLAERIGSHWTSVYDWERGRVSPSARYLIEIAEATGHAETYFFEDDEDEEDDLDAALHRVAAANVALIEFVEKARAR